MFGNRKRAAEYAWWASRLEKLSRRESLSREDTRQGWNLLWSQWGNIHTGILRSKYLPEKLRLALAFRNVDPMAMMVAPTFLMGLSAKGMSREELLGLVDSFADHEWFKEYEGFELPDGDAVYSNGFGGDGLKTVNVSTGAMIIAAAAGACCYKMGSRTYFSHSGSHNFLEMVGVKASTAPEHAIRCLREARLAYIDGVATCDGSTRNIGDGLSIMPRARELMKTMTYPFRFPILCLNPLKPRISFRGVSTLDTELPANVILCSYPYSERFEIVAGMTPERAVIDEVSNIGPTKITEYRDGELRTYTSTPADWGVRTAESKEIRCADAWVGAVKNVAVLRGVCHDANKDLLLINAAEFLYLSGKANSRKEGTEMARAAVDDGLAIEKLHDWVKVSDGQVGVFEMMYAAAARETTADHVRRDVMSAKNKVVGAGAA